MVRKDPPSAEGAGAAAAAGAPLTLPSMVLEMVVTAEQLPTGWQMGNPSPAPTDVAAAADGLASLPPLSPPSAPPSALSARGLPSNSAIKSR